MSNDYIMQVKDVTKEFPGVKALDKICLSVKKGEIYAIVGENGAGKSTLMKILSGAYQLDSGSIVFDGQEVQIKNAKYAVDMGVSIVYQELSNFPAMSIAENIFAGDYPKQKSGAVDYHAMNRKTQELIDQYGLKDMSPGETVRKLSIGRQQIVEILRASSKNAKLLILDEPTSALTEKETNLLFDIMMRLKASGVTILYISHRLDEIFRICDRVGVFRDGRFITEFEVSKTSKDEIVKHMVGRDVAYNYGAHTTKVGEVLLSVKNLSYGSYFKDVSFDLRAGEVLGISGLEGSGRTELIETLYGILKKDSGQVFVKGREVNIKSPIQAKRHGFAFITKDRKKAGLFLDLTLGKNIISGNLRMFSKHSIINFKKANENSTFYKEKFSIKAPSLKTPVMTLSGGNQQKVLLAAWFTSEPKILFVDEPTRGIDVGTKEHIHKLIRELAAQGNSVIMISSDLPEIIGASDRVMIMYEGSVTGILDNTELSEETIVQYASNEVN